MEYLDTAFQQLGFAWKLYNYVSQGKVDLRELDKPIVFQERHMVLAFTTQIFNTHDDLIIACENNLVMAFGAAGITLNRSREEVPMSLPDPIVSEQDQFVALVYQVRNAFAHDIAEPKWAMHPRYARAYQIGRICVDLTHAQGKAFRYEDIGGPDILFRLNDYGQAHIWPHRQPSAPRRRIIPNQP